MNSQFMEFLAMYLLTIADENNPRTIYHDRIDGLLMPFSELPTKGQYWGWM